jgi:hypothetical protein
MDPKGLRVRPQQALAVYAESLAAGGAVALFGDSSLGLAGRLVDLGARSVQAWDPDARRARLEAERADDAVTIKAYDAEAPLPRSVDLAIVSDLGLFDDPAEILARVGALVGDDGVLLVAAANRDVATPGGSRSFEYYELFDLVAKHFTAVTMVAELPFHGVALVPLGEEGEVSGVSVDTQLAGDARVADRFVVVASQRDVAPQPYTVVELPGAQSEAAGAEQGAALRAQAALTEQAEALVRDRDQRVAALSAEVQRLQAAGEAAGQAAGLATTELREIARRAESTEARGAAFERELAKVGEANTAEIRRFEDILKERSEAVRALEIELARRDQMVRDLVATLDEGVESLVVAPPEPVVAPANDNLLEENMRLRELLDAMALDVARREAEAQATAWKVSELEHQLRGPVGSGQASSPSDVTPGANSR